MRHLICVLALTVSLSVFAEDARHPLTRAIDNHANLLFVANLQPDNPQLLDLLTVARAAQQLVTEYEAAEKQLAASKADTFKQQAKALAEGTPVDAAATQAVAAYYAARAQAHAKLLAGVDAQIRQVRRALAPGQVRMIDWSRPAEAGGATEDEAVLEELRQLLSDLNATMRMLERIRYLIASDYITSRVGRLSEFLGDYYRPNTREFNEAMDWMIHLTDEARMVNEEQWPEQAPLFAGRVLQHLGVLEPQQAPEAKQPYNWWDVYYLLTDPQTPAMLQGMLAARGNPAGAQ